MFAFVFIWGVTRRLRGLHRSRSRWWSTASPRLNFTSWNRRSKEPSAATVIQVADSNHPAPAARGRHDPPLKRSPGDIFLRWFYYLHFGNFGDWPVKALWVVLGLAPPFLFATGALMWWNRVLSREARSLRKQDTAVTSVA